MNANIFEEIMHMGLKNIIKCYYDYSTEIRENSIKLTIQLLTRCSTIKPFLPYIFQALKDRTNCVDLQGIDKLPQKLRPHPGQKPKVMHTLLQPSQQIRLLYSKLCKTIILLLQNDKIQMAKHLDDMVNILRTLIMDPSPEIQKQTCEVLQLFCQHYQGILLHFTETMGRAVLLPLISKKSKIRIAALNTLTSILWCGLWKYNAFIFQNLIGFRDPNSVPIKDFYQPSNNINYLATFIIDSNPKVRQHFMKNIKIWVCDLNDKYDHHGKLVPYLLSGLFDPNQQVQQLALSTINEIGKQIQQQKQKQFRDNKQFAIDAQWTWNGKLLHLPIESPLTTRPSIGSRYFIRGHVRKFWTPLYKQIRDINQDNMLRSANLALYGVIYTENYLTQFLDTMIPQLLPSILPSPATSKLVSDKICKIFYYIGRYCQQSAYIHLIKSALQGKLIQNQQFIKCAMKALSMLIKGNLQAIPQDQTLSHKKTDVIEYLTTLQSCDIFGQIYNYNCNQAREIGEQIFNSIVLKANSEQKQQIMQTHFITLIKLFSVSYFQQVYSQGYSLKSSIQCQNNTNQTFKGFVEIINQFQQIHPSTFQSLQQFISDTFCTPPSLMDSSWKIIIIFYRYFSIKSPQTQQISNLFLLTQDTICQSLSQNKSKQLLAFTIKFLTNLINILHLNYQITTLTKSSKLLKQCLANLSVFTIIKKIPIYDQPPPSQSSTANTEKISQQNYSNLFLTSSKCLTNYYLNKIPITNPQLAQLFHIYLKSYQKISKNKQCQLIAIKSIWAIFQKLQLSQKFPQSLSFLHLNIIHYVLPQIIDFCIQRIQQYPDNRLLNFIFSILDNIGKIWPNLQKITQKIPNTYLNYPDLLQKLFKYTLNQKDFQIHSKYVNFLTILANKMKIWFEYELNLAQQQKKFQKYKLIQLILHQTNS